MCARVVDGDEEVTLRLSRQRVARRPEPQCRRLLTVTSAHLALYFFLRSCGPANFMKSTGPE